MVVRQHLEVREGPVAKLEQKLDPEIAVEAALPLQLHDDVEPAQLPEPPRILRHAFARVDIAQRVSLERQSGDPARNA